MHVDMFPRVTLTEDVGALEMMKRDFDFSPSCRGFGGVQLSLVRKPERQVHVAASRSGSAAARHERRGADVFTGCSLL